VTLLLATQVIKDLALRNTLLKVQKMETIAIGLI
jgi:hypothetical protein